MKTKLIIAYIGNIIDAAATLVLTQCFGFKEINPIMAWLLQWPVLATFFKIAVVTCVLVFLYNTERSKHTEAIATVAATLYGGLALYYIMVFMTMFSIPMNP